MVIDFLERGKNKLKNVVYKTRKQKEKAKKFQGMTDAFLLLRFFNIIF